MRVDFNNWRVNVLLHAIGTPYQWGGGDLSTAQWPPANVDCSGFAQNALYAINIINKGAWHDLSANGLANECDAVFVPGKTGELEDCRVGDLCFYGKPGKLTHVTVYLGGGMCIGANGGGSKTNGDDPNACVQVRPATYRSDLVVIGRVKAEHRA